MYQKDIRPIIDFLTLYKIFSLITVNDNGCWEYRKSARKYYRTITINGVCLLLHRVMYRTYNGVLDNQKVIDHICRNVICINPKHLRQVTVSENTKNTARWDTLSTKPRKKPTSRIYYRAMLVKRKAFPRFPLS